MEFFGISIWELLLILVVVLIVLGPNRLPGVARSLGKAIRTIRRASSSFTQAIAREMETPPETSKDVKADTNPKSEKPAADPGAAGAPKQESKPEKPEGQPPQDEQR
jgi:sec-independent protein translocase protein TatB